MRGVPAVLALLLAPGVTWGFAPLRVARRQRRSVGGALQAAEGVAYTELPDSYDDALEDMAASLALAFDSGLGQLTVEFDTAAGDATYTTLKNSVPVAQGLLVGLCQNLGLRLGFDPEPNPGGKNGSVACFFPDEGAAALAKQEWKLSQPKKKKKRAAAEEDEEEEDLTPLVPPCVRVKGLPRLVGDSMIGPSILKDSDQALVLVCPRAEDLASLEKLADEATSRGLPVIMINPSLIDMGVTGFGYAGRRMRERFADNFVLAYQLRTTSWGCLTRQFGRQFTVWVLDESPEAQAAGGYRLLKARGTRVSETEVEELLDEEAAQAGEGEGGNPFKELGKFIQGFTRL